MAKKLSIKDETSESLPDTAPSSQLNVILSILQQLTRKVDLPRMIVFNN